MHQQRPARTGPADFGDASQRARPARRRLTFEGLEPRQMLSLSPALLADIGIDDDSSPQNLFATDSAVYFSALGESGKVQIYKQDEDGLTGLLQTDRNTSSNSFPTIATFIAFNDHVFAAVNDGDSTDLWRTNGTPEGTTHLKQLESGSYGSVVEFAILGDTIIFASFRSNSCTLWQSDGTSQGTVPIAQFGSYISEFTLFDNRLYFSAADQTHGAELWSTDGTATGTTLVSDIAQGTFGSSPRGIITFDGALYFSAATSDWDRDLWRSDGTAAGTEMVAGLDSLPLGFSSSFGLVNANGVLYFTASDPTNGTELWKFDLSSESATLIRDIRLGGQDSNIFGLRALGSGVVFGADDGVHGRELWRSDGTAEGTQLVRDINAGNADAFGSDYFDGDNVRFGGDVYFAASDGLHGFELWKSDGTAQGTVRVTDIQTGVRSSFPQNLFAAGDALYFTARDHRGRELWTSDGTAMGTSLVANVNQANTISSNAGQFTPAGAVTYFVATTAAAGGELWRTDGTQAGTFLIKDTIVSDIDGHLANLTMVGDTLFFTAQNGRQLWKSDGTAQGTQFVAAINQGAYTQGPDAPIETPMMNVNGTLFFLAEDPAYGRELWKSDGTSLGTMLVKDIDPSGSWNSRHTLGVASGNLLYFAANDGVHGTELWVSDGTASGTQIIDLNPGPGSSNPIFGTLFNGAVYFSAAVPGGYALLRSDGTVGGVDVVQMFGSTRPANYMVVGGLLYFTEFKPFPEFDYQRLWQSDGTTEGTRYLWQSSTREYNPWNWSLTEFKGAIYFAEKPMIGLRGLRLWRLQPDLGSVELVKQLTDSYLVEETVGIHVVDVRLFIASTVGMWTSDGTTDGTQPVLDNSGNQVGRVNEIANSGDVLLFAVRDDVHGFEPWILAPPVVARLFYNNSKFDQVAGASGDADDAALAVDKLPYIPGNGRTTGENVSSYSKGINGLFIDLASGHGEITADDFNFRMGTSTDPSGWNEAPAPISITVRAGAGIAGHDRVEIVFADEAIKNTWLEVTVRGNDARGGFHTNTALDASSVFYFGSRVGDTFTGNSAAAAVTSAADALRIRAAGGTFAASGNRYDINRDGVVSAGDALLARFNSGILLMLDLPQLTDPPASPTMIAATQMADPLSSAVASALAEALARHVDASASASSHASGLIDRVPTTGPPRANAIAREAAAHFADEALLALTEGESLDETAAEDDDRLLDALLSLS